jgi:hypothetical protein
MKNIWVAFAIVVTALSLTLEAARATPASSGNKKPKTIVYFCRGEDRVVVRASTSTVIPGGIHVCSTGTNPHDLSACIAKYRHCAKALEP